jgi:hypothetical protein
LAQQTLDRPADDGMILPRMRKVVDFYPGYLRRPDGLRACVRSPSSGGATRRPVGASRNDKQERRVSRLRDACIFRLTRPLLRERLFRYGVPIHEEELAMKLRGLFIAAAVLLMPTAALAAHYHGQPEGRAR